MPLLSTRGAASAAGFGFAGKPKVLTTYVFPSGTSTWTAPPGVSLLASAVGKGADGVSDTNIVMSYSSVFAAAGTGGPQPAYMQWGTITSDTFSFISTINASGSGTVTLTTWGTQYIVLSDDTWDSVPNGYVSGGKSTYKFSILTDIVWIRGSASYFTTGSGATSGNVVYSAGNGNLLGTATYQGAAGAATTGFSLSFPGGAYISPTGYPATNTTFTNVAVTPGTTYTIVNNGALTITYYV